MRGKSQTGALEAGDWTVRGCKAGSPVPGGLEVKGGGEGWSDSRDHLGETGLTSTRGKARYLPRRRVTKRKNCTFQGSLKT